MNRRSFLLASTAGTVALALAGPSFALPSNKIKMYKSPECDCCEGHAKHLEDNGFQVTIAVDPDLRTRTKKLGLPDDLVGCHTALIGGYVFEGHVPAKYFVKILNEKPKMIGLAIPGMPIGVPGMDGERDEPLDIFVIDDSAKTVYATI